MAQIRIRITQFCLPAYACCRDRVLASKKYLNPHAAGYTLKRDLVTGIASLLHSALISALDTGLEKSYETDEVDYMDALHFGCHQKTRLKVAPNEKTTFAI